MTQDELWLAKWQEAIDFLETNHRKPSKFIPEERNLRSWWKHNVHRALAIIIHYVASGPFVAEGYG